MVALEALLLSLLLIASALSVLPWLSRHSKAASAAPEKGGNPRVATRGGEEEMKLVFGALDKNKDGFISKEELGESLGQMGISACADDGDDSNGLIGLHEFSGIFDTAASSSSSALRGAFDVFDRDKDGLITAEELEAALGAMGMKEGEREESCREMIRRVDVDGDGMVSFDEFKTMMASSSSGAATS